MGEKRRGAEDKQQKTISKSYMQRAEAQGVGFCGNRYVKKKLTNKHCKK